jgi:diguanylate cyclase (GGDEF)-like protein/PAS domain S-box-containing protein
MTLPRPVSEALKGLRGSFVLQLTAVLLLMSLLPLLAYYLVSFQTTRQTILDMALSQSQVVLRNQRDYLALQVEQVEALAISLGQNEELSQTLAAAGASRNSLYDTLATKARIGYLLSNFRHMKGLASIDLFALDGTRYHVGDSLAITEVNAALRDSFMSETLASRNLLLWHGVEDNIQRNSAILKVLALTKLVMRTDSSWLKAEPVGMLLINYSTDELYEHFSHVDVGMGARLMVVDSRQRLIFDLDKPKIGTAISPDLAQLLQGPSGSLSQQLDGVQVLLGYEQIPGVNWYVVSVVPRDTLLAPMQNIRRVGLLMLVAAVLLVLVLVWQFSVRIVQPIARISDGFRRFQGGWLQPGWRMELPASLLQIRELVQLFNAFLDGVKKRQEAELQLRIAAIAFESQEGIFITDAQGVILQVNRAFSSTTGFSADEAVGQMPRILNSGRHDADFFRHMHESIWNKGFWAGEIWNRCKSGELHPEWMTITAVRNENGEMTHQVATLMDITDRKASEDEIRHLAFYDPLTGLPNRRLFQDRLRQALLASARTARLGAVVFLDLDKFKTLNDTLGHDMGDLLLQQVGQRLVQCVREVDTVARLGGDEFTLLLENLSTGAREAAAEAERIGAKILKALSQPYDLAGTSHHGSCSMGITLLSDHQQSAEDLMKQADIAMYRAKESGRNALRFFDPLMQAEVMAREALESGLRAGLVHGEFRIYFQPQVDALHHVIGAEVLVRWQHPQRGLLEPAGFIGVAEDSGLILPLGAWVLETACRQLRQWAGQPVLGALVLSVNVSARQLGQENFVDEVQEILQRTEADPRRLKLELTESLLVNNVEDAIVKFSRLQKLGVTFSLDDFGTGYSSLSYLRRLPINELKIDQSFVQRALSDPGDAKIAQAVIALGQSMGFQVIAEGVETTAQFDFLLAQGCDAFQGYLFGKPMPLQAFEQRLA